MKRVQEHEEIVTLKIKAIALNVNTVLNDHKEKANLYVTQMNQIGKEIKNNAKHKVNDILKDVSV
jgi:hypothetical protein